MISRVIACRLLAVMLLGTLAVGSGLREGETQSRVYERAARDGTNEQDASRVRLRFSHSPTLATDAALREWVATELRREVGLKGSTGMVAADEGRMVGNHIVWRILQTARGLPVAYRESRLVMDATRKPFSLNGRHSSFPQIPSATPRLSSEQALASAGADLDAPVAPAHRLVFWPKDDVLQLAYEIDGTFPMAAQPTAPFERVYVNAHTGDVLQRLSMTNGAKDRRIYDHSLACRAHWVSGPLPGPAAWNLLLNRNVLVRDEMRSAGDRNAERLFALLGEYYEFLRLTLGRDSLDNAGKPLVAAIGVRFNDFVQGTPQCVGDVINALFITSMRFRGRKYEDFMLLPNSMLDYPEIIGHEFTHGLIGNGSRLVYQDEPGALNEAISDAVGATFAAWLENGRPRNRNATLRMRSRSWQLRGPQGVIRDMRRPRLVRISGKPLPDHYSDFVHTTEDNGGVHINSSIVNYGFYLLSEGGRHRKRRAGPKVTGIGAMKAVRIFGTAAADILTSQDNFEDARYAFAIAAESLFGRNSEEWVAVHTAMDAVGIPGDWAKPQPSPAPAPTPAPQPSPAPAPTPAPQPSPAPAPTPAPQPSPAPAPTPAPQPSPAPAPTPAPQPSPAPAPTPAPQPNPLPDPPEQRDGSPFRPQAMLLALAAVLALLTAAFVAHRFRPVQPSQANAPLQPGAPSNSQRLRAPFADIPKPQRGLGETIGTLALVNGPTRIPLSQALLVSREGLVIGRAQNLCHVELLDRAVSRRHVRLRLMAGQLFAEDLNSLHGTQADGVELKPFEPRAMHPDGELAIAGLKFQLLAHT